jgi:hypothetical protein
MTTGGRSISAPKTSAMCGINGVLVGSFWHPVMPPESATSGESYPEPGCQVRPKSLHWFDFSLASNGTHIDPFSSSQASEHRKVVFQGRRFAKGFSVNLCDVF